MAQAEMSTIWQFCNDHAGLCIASVPGSSLLIPPVFASRGSNWFCLRG
jgi:hypothetical protein